MTLEQLSMPAKIAMILAVAGFVVTIEFSNSSTVNGQVVACNYIDYGSLGLGAAAILVGAFAGFTGLVRKTLPSAGLGGLAILLGIYHVLSGLGMVGAPCG